MASTQKSREERARSAAQKAADELAASRREREPHQAHHEAATLVSQSSVQEAIERAKKYAVDEKEGVRRALAAGDDAVTWKGETAESAWQQGQDVRRRAAEKAQEEAQRVREPQPSEEDKGRAATENILEQAKAAMKGAFRDKMVMPTDVVEEKRAEAAAGRCAVSGDDRPRP